MLQEILDMHPNAPLIKRQGEVNAWDNADFRAAVKATGKKQVVLASIVTDVSCPSLSRSLLNSFNCLISLGLHRFPRFVSRRGRLHRLPQFGSIWYLQQADCSRS